MNVGIVGLGLIGGSIARALKGKHRVIGVDVNPRTLRAALSCRVIQQASLDVRAVKTCSLIVVATPLDRVARTVQAVARVADAGAVILEVGGVKSEVDRILQVAVDVIEGHPMAGTEHAGFKHSSARLFVGRPFLLIPARVRRDSTRRRVAELVRALHARPVWLKSAADHDRTMSLVSHLPHVAAFTLLRIAGRERSLAGPSFRDATRVARSNPEFVAAMLSQNRKHVSAAIGRWIGELKRVKSLLRRRRALIRYLAAAQDVL